MSYAARRAADPTPAEAARLVVGEDEALAADGVAGPYVGLVTRALAFGLDAALINLVAIITAALAALALSMLTLPQELDTLAAAVGAAIYMLWLVGYFVTFWATTGQTPGSRLLRIRVRAVNGDRLKPRRALLRFVGLTLAALPFFAGFALILVDNRRRGLHDIIARTVVVEAAERDDVPPPARRPSAGPRPDRRPA